MHGAEAIYLELQDKIGILENSYSKVWEKLELEDQRFDRLETRVQGLDIKLDEKVEMIQDWFVHISTQVHTEVPTELVNSIQEVIADMETGRTDDLPGRGFHFPHNNLQLGGFSGPIDSHQPDAIASFYFPSDIF